MKNAATLEISDLIQFLRQELSELPDTRKTGNNPKYKVEDAVMGAFSVFFTQSPQKLVRSYPSRNNLWLFSTSLSMAKKTVISVTIETGQQLIFMVVLPLLGDDLYSHQPICELALEPGYNFIFVCLESSHKTLYEWLEFLEKSGEIKPREKKEWDGRKNLIYRYRYASRVPLREGDSSLEVNWCEGTVINEKTQKIIYQNNWITNHEINEKNIRSEFQLFVELKSIFHGQIF